MVLDTEGSFSIFVGVFSFPNESGVLKEESFEAAYIVILAILTILGICGTILNGWALHLFCKTKTVSRNIAYEQLWILAIESIMVNGK